MRNIFIGFLLVFLNLSFNIGDCIIGIVPNFIGYIFILKGIDEFKNDNQFIYKMRNFAIGMIIYTSIIYALDLFTISVKLGLLGNTLKLVSTIVCYYILYNIIKGIREIESLHNIDIQGETLRSKWDIMVFSQIASVVFVSIPIILIVLIIISLITAIMFFVAFNTTTKLYEQFQKPQLSDNIE